MFEKDFRVHQSNSVECFHIIGPKWFEIRMEFFTEFGVKVKCTNELHQGNFSSWRSMKKDFSGANLRLFLEQYYVVVQ